MVVVVLGVSVYVVGVVLAWSRCTPAPPPPLPRPALPVPSLLAVSLACAMLNHVATVTTAAPQLSQQRPRQLRG